MSEMFVVAAVVLWWIGVVVSAVVMLRAVVLYLLGQIPALRRFHSETNLGSWPWPQGRQLPLYDFLDLSIAVGPWFLIGVYALDMVKTYSSAALSVIRGGSVPPVSPLVHGLVLWVSIAGVMRVMTKLAMSRPPMMSQSTVSPKADQVPADRNPTDGTVK